MIQVRRLGAVAAALGLVALITCTQVHGGPGKDDELKKWRASGSEPQGGKAPDDLDDDLAATKFAQQKVVAFQAREGGLHIGWQIQPPAKADDKDSRPRRGYVRRRPQPRCDRRSPETQNAPGRKTCAPPPQVRRLPPLARFTFD